LEKERPLPRPPQRNRIRDHGFFRIVRRQLLSVGTADRQQMSAGTARLWKKKRVLAPSPKKSHWGSWLLSDCPAAAIVCRHCRPAANVSGHCPPLEKEKGSRALPKEIALGIMASFGLSGGSYCLSALPTGSNEKARPKRYVLPGFLFRCKNNIPK